MGSRLGLRTGLRGRRRRGASVAPAFTPASVPGLTAWYDGSDAATITQAAGLISQVADKSGNGLNLTQATGALQPTVSAADLNSKNTIAFNSQCLFTDLANLTPSELSAIIVCRFASASGNGARPFTIGRASAVDGVVDGFIPFRRDAGNAKLGPTTSTSFTNYHTISYDTWLIMYANRQAASLNSFLNGADERTLAAGISALAGTFSRICMGANLVGGAPGTVYLNGRVAEVCLFTTTPTATNRQKLEGHLAHKWGLTALLAAGHPYKSAAP